MITHVVSVKNTQGMITHVVSVMNTQGMITHVDTANDKDIYGFDNDPSPPAGKSPTSKQILKCDPGTDSDSPAPRTDYDSPTPEQILTVMPPNRF
ncbi:Hypothetical predicted protein [Mytilus galloprovincialis]|uniref:Uncharacterized protein n=1 Tax=Mytilus galloprovincialis TaxID=29158 RepID=A0A8B6HRH4_MYTGA|nr:Hypothetical predicted protein [Mytilus galloprovincialis]